MTRLAAADDSRFSVSALEVEREGPSYTYETLELLAEERGETELVFVMGADAAVGLESWRNPERVVELARLAVARRAGRLRRRGRGGDAQPRRRRAGDDAGDAAVRRLLLGRARARRRRPAAALPGPRAGRPLHRGEGDLLDERDRSRRRWPGAWPSSPTRKKPRTIVVLDMRELVAYTDFLAICTARNERQAKAIVDEVRVQVKQETALLPGGVDGGGEAGWIVLDYLDCVLHVFTAGGARALPARGPLARGAAPGARPRRARSALRRQRLSDVAVRGRPLRCRAWDSFKRALFGYRRPEVEAAISGPGRRGSARSSDDGRRAQRQAARSPSSRGSSPRSRGW